MKAKRKTAAKKKPAPPAPGYSDAKHAEALNAAAVWLEGQHAPITFRPLLYSVLGWLQMYFDEVRVPVRPLDAHETLEAMAGAFFLFMRRTEEAHAAHVAPAPVKEKKRVTYGLGADDATGEGV